VIGCPLSGSPAVRGETGPGHRQWFLEVAHCPGTGTRLLLVLDIDICETCEGGAIQVRLPDHGRAVSRSAVLAGEMVRSWWRLV
jgi:hypothetical protein